ncbi:MAG: APC family permease [Emcibacteraceae bacterium]|nr:APC family permease [Emcibacteraceae bacterium]MDG1858511.1 APC family permease [Emcibacteraceae bacterium]
MTGVNEKNDKHLKREIGLFAAGFLVLNGLIGAGIFGLPGVLSQQAGMFSPWLFLIFGALIIPIVLTFAALASFFQSTGGPILYASTAFGPLVGFQTGWLLYVGRVASFAGNINLMFDYISYIWNGASEPFIRAILILLVTGGLALINIIGIKRAIQAINLFTFLKIIPLILMLLLGLQYVSPEGLLPSDLPKFDDLGSSVLLIMFAFVGFEAALVTAGETKNPRTTLPRALVSMVLIITVFYFAIQLIYVSVNPSGSENAPLIELGKSLMGPIGGTVLILTAVFSICGNITGVMISGPRMTYAMAEENSLPPWFSNIHEKYKTPVNSIIFKAVFVYLLAVSGTFVYLAIASALTRMLAYIICIASLPVIKKKVDQETRDQATKLPGGYFIPIIGMLVCLGAISQASLNSWLYMIGFITLGSLLFGINKILIQKK